MMELIEADGVADGHQGVEPLPAQHGMQPDALQRAINAHRNGDLDSAERFYRLVLDRDPRQPMALNDLGILLVQRGQRTAGEELIRQAVASKPDYAEARSNLGTLLRERGEIDAAIAEYEQAVSAKPAYADAYFNLGLALERKGDAEGSLAAFDRAIASRRDYPEALFGRGNALRAKGRVEEAIAAYREALALKPDLPAVHTRLGVALGEIGEFDAAIAAYRNVLDLDSRHLGAHSNLAMAQVETGQIDAAIAAYRRALDLAPDWPHAHFGLSLALLLNGDYAEGWREYEWRWKGAVKNIKPRDLPKPLWQGEDLTGKTLLLYCEQGLGDTLQFVRFVPGLAERGGRVVLEVPSRLVSLLRLTSAAETLIGAGTPLPEFDFHLPLLSIPSVIGLTESTIPAEVPFLAADPVRIWRWRERLSPRGFRVGIAWQGFPNAEIDKGRSIPLRCFAPVAAVPGVRLISLQKNYGLDQLDSLPEGMRVETLGSDFDAGPDAFLDTAAVMASLDLVITSDTSIAHLAGALGRPVWVVLKTNPDWRWLLDREDSPWYPTARLFRQRTRGDWNDVLQRVAGELRDVVAGKAGKLYAPGRRPEDRLGRAGARFALGFAWQRDGRLDKAATAYCKTIGLDPDHAEAHCNLGVIRHGQGQIDEAVSLYRRAIAIKSDHFVAHGNLAVALEKKGDLAGAIVAARDAAAGEPEDASAQTRLADLLRRSGDAEAAIEVYQRAAAICPDDATVQFNLALCWQRTGELCKAAEGYRSAIALDPQLAQAHANLGVALADTNRLEEGIEAYRQALRLQPNNAQFHANFGVMLARLGNTDAALVHYRRAVEIAPGHAEAHANLALGLLEKGMVDAAIEADRTAIALKPDYAEAHFNLSLLMLLKGDFRDGWSEYEWRWKGGVKELQPRKFSKPQWQGENLDGKPLLLHAEQGLGDTLQFARFAPVLAARGARVLLAVPQELVALIRSTPDLAAVVGGGERLPEFDFHLPLMSLPSVLGTTEDTIPREVPYLLGDPERVSAWRERLGPDGFKIGIAWQGRPGGIDKGRSIPLRAFSQIAAVAGVRLISLQRRHGLDQLGGLPNEMRVETLGANFDAGPDAFLDTAAVMASLDLVITSDTSIAHLAGALARPVWIALKHTPEWRWLLEREDSPWYPTARLFRQREPGNWDEVFARLAAELARAVKDGPRRASPKRPAAGAGAPLGPNSVESRCAAFLQAGNRSPLVFTWGMASSFGWGVLGLNLALAWAEDPDLLPVCGASFSPDDIAIDPMRRRLLGAIVENSLALRDVLAAFAGRGAKLPFPVLHTVVNRLRAVRAAHNVELHGRVNVGVIFLEDTRITEEERERSRHYSLLIAGSTWNKQLLEDKQITTPVTVIQQGIDITLFHPGPRSGLFKDRFVVFSGGKLEYRKGQDLVLLAFRAFAQRHPEALLVSAWHSPWPDLAHSLTANSQITPVPVANGRVDAAAWAAANGVPGENFLDLGPVANFQMPQILRECDVALFLNRGEGGTNLVAMECLACAVPCVISANTGHLDLIKADSCVPIMRQRPVLPLPGSDQVEGWGESDIEEAVEALEAMWRDRGRATRIGQAGAAQMAEQSWSKYAAALKEVVLPYVC